VGYKETAPESATGGSVLHALNSDFMARWKPAQAGSEGRKRVWRIFMQGLPIRCAVQHIKSFFSVKFSVTIRNPLV
jgi:hypothetical protein